MRRIRAPKPGVRNTGPRKQRRAAVISFSLARPALVRFRIQRVAPSCTFIGTFAVRGHAGVNRVRFAGRFRGRPLPPGTYTLRATALRNGRYVFLGRTRIVIVPAGVDVDSARPQPSTCRSGSSGATATATATASGDAGAADMATEAEGREDENLAGGASGGGGGGEASVSGTAGEAVAGTGGSPRDGRMPGISNPFEDAPAWLQPLLLAALALAIVALLAAAVPVAAVRPAGVAPAVERRRTELALFGALVLGAVAVTALVL